jgi:hypothetical protein
MLLGLAFQHSDSESSEALASRGFRRLSLGDKTFELLREDDAWLLAALVEVERGETTSALPSRAARTTDREQSVPCPHRQQQKNHGHHRGGHEAFDMRG